MFLHGGVGKSFSLNKAQSFTPKLKNVFRFALRAYLTFVVAVCAFILTAILIRLKVYSGDSLITLIPNLLLYTPYKLTNARVFNYINSYRYDVHQTYEPQHIPEIFPNKEGSLDYEELRSATNGFRDPAVVRGLYSDTVAMKKWTRNGYLEGKLSNWSIPLFADGDESLEKKTVIRENLGTAFNSLVGNRKETKQLFFPNHAPGYHAEDELMEAVDDLVRNDFELEKKLWRGYSTENHKTFLHAQIIAANGFVKEGGGKTSGTFWHCAPGNNYFIQAVGRKRWMFLSQKYSSYMQPGRVGMAAMAANMELDSLQKHLPVKYVDLEAGDMLYNPDWHWHRIENHEGLSVGVPIRELNRTLAFSNNFQFTTITIWNVILKKVFKFQQTIWDNQTPTHIASEVRKEATSYL